MKVVKKHHIEEMYQWNKNNDHPLDNTDEDKALGYEGKVVRYFRNPEVPGDTKCVNCKHIMSDHGWIEDGWKGHVVCPGDYIVSQVNKKFTAFKKEVILRNYDLVMTDEPFISKSFSDRCFEWLTYAFNSMFPEIITCSRERNHRFLEESLELVQAFDLPEIEALELVRHVYSKPKGEPFQEAGGVSTTFTLLCRHHGIDVNVAAETELKRDYLVVDHIRSHQEEKNRRLLK